MLRLRVMGVMLAATLIAGLAEAGESESGSYPAFSELFELVKKNLAGASETDLNRMAVDGFLQQLNPQVRLSENQPVQGTNSNPLLLTQTNIYESAYSYIRVSNVDDGFAGQLGDYLRSIQKTNQLKGLILDLRFGGGQSYLDSAKTADLFLTNSIPLLQWEGRPILSTAKTNAFRFPTMVLINKETWGASEALASVLREADIALLIGTATAGRAASYKEFTLKSGQKVQIAASPIVVGGTRQLTRDGVRPDIQVSVSPEDEKAYYKDAYKIVASSPGSKVAGLFSSSSTNKAPRSRINEAELVRMQREGISPDDDDFMVSAPNAASAPSLQDPVLLRALDLLKALALHVMR